METTASDLKRFSTAWGSTVPPEQVAEFLRLTRERRETAILRVEVVRTLTSEARPTTALQREGARRIGVSLQRLQALMRAWRGSPGIGAVVPHAADAPRPPRPGPGREIAARLVRKAVDRDRLIAEPTLHRRIAAVCVRLGRAPPARMTVRSLLLAERARTRADGGGLGADHGGDRDPPSFGEVVLVTSLPFAARIVDGRREPRRAAALLLADAGSGLVAAVDYEAGFAELARSLAGTVGTRLVLARGWRRPRRLLLAPPLPQVGGWRGRLLAVADGLGVGVTDVPMRRVRRWLAGLHWRGQGWMNAVEGHPEAAPDPGWPTLTADEFRAALQDAVDDDADRVELRADEGPFDPEARDEVEQAVRDLRALLTGDAG